MTLHGDPDLVAGSIFGLRQFRTIPHPADRRRRIPPDALFPLFDWHPAPWRSGWNLAMCPDRGGPADVRLGCGCGFYAYTAPPKRLLLGIHLVTGIVEGAGVTIEYERGFRAQRARVVALVWPSTAVLFNALFTVLCTAVVVMCTMSLRVDFNWFTAFLCALNAASAVVDGVRVYQGTRTWRRARHAARKFNVPLYRSCKAARRAHPLGITAPQMPTTHHPDNEKTRE